MRSSSLALAVALVLPTAAHAAVPGAEAEQPVALGFQLDLFPTLASALNGRLGYAPQLWLGIEPVRLRLLVAHLELPDALAFAGEGFRDPSTTAFAAVVDYTFGEHFDGFWVCAGLELWQQSIAHERVAGEAEWSSVIGTAGGGYIWRFYRNFYLDPWLGVHWTLNPAAVQLGGYRHDPQPLVANASVKVGVFVDL